VDAAVVLEGTPAFDVPDPTREAAAGDLPGNPATRMGAGVVLTLADASMVSDPRVIRFLQETADAQTIPYQMKTVGGGGTDGGAIHTAQTGVPTMTLSVPCRYIHSPSALLDLNDYDSALRLSQAVLRRIDSATFQRG
ncbi:MAG: M42 family peptidase, partial [Chloroflexi bacterium]|nr:M42 family peptidase [Chloroflexota bacterium]